MENAITAALSKQIVLSHALDIAANNVANQTTAGFKAERVNFSEYLSVIENPDGGDPTLSLVYDADSYTDFTPGGVEATYAPFDFAIDGDGFFAVDTDAGVRYTRDGHFGLSEFGEVVNRGGKRVLDQTGAPILIDPEAGPVLLSPEGELQQNGGAIAQLGVFSFEDARSLRRQGGNLFASAEAPSDAPAARIRQGFIEISNVQPIRAMTEMIDIHRAYENAAQLIKTSTDLAREAVKTLTEPA